MKQSDRNENTTGSSAVTAGAPSLVDLAATQIIDWIREKKLKQGDRLPNEQTLAVQLNVGRGTLREAIRLLSTRNILVVRQGSGTYVADQIGIPEDPLGLTFIENGPKLAMNLVDLRLMLEPDMAATAAERITPEQKLELTARFNNLEQKLRGSDANYVNEDALFHCYIAECAGNSVLQNLMPTIIAAVRISIQASGDGIRDRSIIEHRCILNAICRNDAAGARYAMISHLNVTREFFAQQEFLRKTMWAGADRQTK